MDVHLVRMLCCMSHVWMLKKRLGKIEHGDFPASHVSFQGDVIKHRGTTMGPTKLVGYMDANSWENTLYNTLAHLR